MPHLHRGEGLPTRPALPSRCLAGVGFVCGHELADLRLGLRPEAAAIFQLRHERLVVQGKLTKARGRDAMLVAEGVNISE